MTLTPRQAEILSYIREHITAKGYPPTVREIGRRFGIKTTNGVTCHLKALEKKKLIVREVGKSRAIKVVEDWQ